LVVVVGDGEPAVVGREAHVERPAARVDVLHVQGDGVDQADRTAAAIGDRDPTAVGARGEVARLVADVNRADLQGLQVNSIHTIHIPVARK
jgi:hypothetical protein